MSQKYIYTLDNIVEVRETPTVKEANRLLEDGWKLLAVPHFGKFIFARYESR